jgi:G patch domain-containing protein 1
MLWIPQDFMDEDDDSSLGRELKARTQFDTFGKRIQDEARTASEDALGALLSGRDGSGNARAPAIPGPVIDELIVPSSQPIGKKLLAAMGWREGQGIGPRAKRKVKKRAAEDGGHESDSDDPYAANFTFAPQNTSVFSVAPKNDVYGLGYDPHVGAPEFKRRATGSATDVKPKVVTISHALVTGASAGGFGTGVLSDDEDVDRLGGDVDVYGADVRSGYYRSLGDEEDEDNVFGKVNRRPHKKDEPKPLTDGPKRVHATHDLPGFVRSSTARVADRQYELPPVPKDFKPVHAFTAEDDAEFARLRALVGATVPNAKPNVPMNAQSRAILLGEKPVIITSQPAPVPSARHSEAAAIAESRFVPSSGSSSLYVSPDAGVGGLMSKQEFESRSTCGVRLNSRAGISLHTS